jgi:uncharacterized protein (DUF2252 family)
VGHVSATASPSTGPTEAGYRFPKLTRSGGEAAQLGRELRKRLPRRSVSAVAGADRDAVSIVEDQNRDRVPELVPIRIGRMVESPFAFYRGSAAVMAADLSAEPDTGVELVVCGDAHLVNFGLFASPDRRVLFDLNDFDEAAFGPWEWDVKRLVTSMVVAGRDHGLGDDQCREAALGAARGYRVGLNRMMQLSALERYYFRVETDWLESWVQRDAQKLLRKSVERARKHTSERVLERITTADGDGTPQIVDEPPITQHGAGDDLAFVVELYEAYRKTVHTDVALLLQQFRVVDSVLRIVGVGSVGTRCHVALLLGPMGEPLFLQVKEAPPSVVATYGGRRPGAGRTGEPGPGREGWRVVAGQRVLQAASDPFLGWVENGGRDFFCRQFRDMKGSIDLATLGAEGFVGYGRLCGGVLARAHAQSPDAAVVSGYLGRSERFDEAVTEWALGYAQRVERDHAALCRAVETGRLPCERGV